MFTDDIEDACEDTCIKCGGKYQLRCSSVVVEMECTESKLKGDRDA